MWLPPQNGRGYVMSSLLLLIGYHLQSGLNAMDVLPHYYSQHGGSYSFVREFGWRLCVTYGVPMDTCAVASHGLSYRRQGDKRTFQHHWRCARKDSTYIKTIAYILKEHATHLHRMSTLAIPTPQQTGTDLELFLEKYLRHIQSYIQKKSDCSALLGSIIWATCRISNAALEMPV